jgi:LacI family transcriptional regulator
MIDLPRAKVKPRERSRSLKTKRVTLADVARRAGVSPTAASFVLSGRRAEMRLSPDVETRVMEAARETGYRPNIVSRALRTGASHTIGFVSDTVATQRFAGDIIRGALEAARERGYLLFVGETEGDPELERELIEAMLDRQVHGVALTSMYTRKVSVPKALLERPAVLLNAYPLRAAPIASVVPDELEAGRTAARVLVDAGYRDGVYLVGAGPHPNRVPKGAMAAVLRLQGIREVADSAGMRIEGAVLCRDWQPEIGFEAAQQLLATKRPKALVCFNDRLSVGALHALEEHGLEVPRDVSIVSFDDDPIASWIRPQLTTIALPHYELGRAAIDLLLDGERARQPHVHLVPMPLRERASVRHA